MAPPLLYRPVQIWEHGKPPVPHDGIYEFGTITAFPGEVSVIEQDLSLAVAYCRLIAPWMQLVTASEIERDGKRKRGVCVYAGNVIFLSLYPTAHELLVTTWHECWHAVEAKLPPSTIEEIESCLGPFYFEGRDYWGLAQERRARLFQGYASMRHDGAPPITGSRLYEIFEAAWLGDLAREIVAEEERVRRLLDEEWGDVAA